MVACRWAENASAPPLSGRRVHLSRRPCSSAPQRLCPARPETAIAIERSRQAQPWFNALASAANPSIHAPGSTAILYRADRMVFSSHSRKGAKSPKLSIVKGTTPPAANAPCSSRQGCNPSPPRLASLNSRIEGLLVFRPAAHSPRKKTRHSTNISVFNTPWSVDSYEIPAKLRSLRIRRGLLPLRAVLAHRRPCIASRKSIDGDE